MRSRPALILSIRTSFVLAILVFMPMMALPPVTNQIRRIHQDWVGSTNFLSQSSSAQGNPSGESLVLRSPALDGPIPAGTVESHARIDHSADRRAGVPAAQLQPAQPVDLRNVAKQMVGSAEALVEVGTSHRASPDRMRSMLNRLQQLGATYTSLETHPEDSALYRFRCQVPIRDTVYSRTFEHSGRAPETAMSQVLKKVESWHQTRYGREDPAARTARRDPGGLP